MQENWASVLPFTGVCQAFIYKTPAHISIKEGCLVKIPLRSRTCLGVVDAILNTPPNFSTSEILEVVYPLPVLSKELLNLGKWMANYYGQSYQNIFETFLPKKIRQGRGYLVPKKVKNSLAKDSDNEEELSPSLTLTQEQKTVFDALCKSLKAGEYETHLLFGVTGSGKTEIYSRLAEEVLQAGGSVLWLVPEIALTLPALEKIRARFAAYNPAIWHSLLTEGHRLKVWREILERKTSLLIGTRSALFLPLNNLRLIVVDEEHEPSYKNGETPRYHGRDTAIYRAFLNKAVCILGSATPSLETWHNAQSGKYKIHFLRHRALGQNFPTMHIVDMRYEKPFCGALAFSAFLREKIAERLDNKEQCILFLNRRGYATHIQCKACGHAIYCPNCHVTLVYHRSENLLRCHLCGKSSTMPHHCPLCQSSQLKSKGVGTQRLEDVVTRVFPTARTARIDIDSVSRRNSENWLDLVKNNAVDILIGTQMIAKGLDFPNVTLVGVLNADAALHVSDFRAEERAFQLLVQVAGRSGRGHKPSTVVVQTFSPQNEHISRAKNLEIEVFLKNQIQLRKEFSYPPYRHIIRHLFRGRSREKVWFFAEQWVQFLSKTLAEKDEFRGPVWAPKEKINEFYRCSVFFFVKNVSATLPKLQKARENFKLPADVIDIFDIDPLDFS